MILLKSKYRSEKISSDYLLIHQRDASCRYEYSHSDVLGKILKIYTVPEKMCPGDCLYCTHGKTSCKTVDRNSFYSLKVTIACLEKVLKENDLFDYIVITGHGETALDADLPWLIKAIRKISLKPIAIESCGSLLWRSSVRRDMLDADAVFVNVDVADRLSYHIVNRYHQVIPYSRYMDGLMNFCSSYSCNLFINVCLLNGINSHGEYLSKLSSLVKLFEPVKILVSTIDADAEKMGTLSVSDEDLKMSLRYFGPAAQVVTKS